MTDAFKQDDLVKELLIYIDEIRGFKSVTSECCIYRVPITIRRVNEKLYTPQLISVGPLHYGKPELADMEKRKTQYMKRFFQRITPEKVDRIVSFIKDSEEQIRVCYTEPSLLKSLEFITMILRDSIFIIEIFCERLECKSEILLDTVPVSYSLWSDLQLFENQIPYFLLEEIYKLAFDGFQEPTFMELSIRFFGHFMGEQLCPLTPELRVKHFTDWRRISLLKNWPRVESGEVVYDLPCAVKLHDSGIKFKSTHMSLLDIEFEVRRRQIPFFEVHELQIPQLQVSDETECLFLNIIALEHCLYPKDAKFCSYVELLNFLINTEEDVDLLVENRIISNYLGDNASVAIMLNKLNQLVVAGQPSLYYNICMELKEHYSNRWNRAKAGLRRAYFNRGTAGFGALILLLLTIVQTLCSIWQVMQFK